jgi:hypothetical protein
MQGKTIRWRIPALLLAAPIMLYPLSVGPVARWSGTEYFNEALLPTVYWPLREAARVDCVGVPIIAYINLWLNVFDREAFHDRELGARIGWGRGVPGAPISTPGPPHDFALPKERGTKDR